MWRSAAAAFFDDIAEVLSRSELEETATAYKKQAGFDIEALNSSPLIMGVWEPVSEATA